MGRGIYIGNNDRTGFWFLRVGGGEIRTICAWSIAVKTNIGIVYSRSNVWLLRVKQYCYKHSSCCRIYEIWGRQYRNLINKYKLC